MNFVFDNFADSSDRVNSVGLGSEGPGNFVAGILHKRPGHGHCCVAVVVYKNWPSRCYGQHCTEHCYCDTAVGAGWTECCC